MEGERLVASQGPAVSAPVPVPVLRALIRDCTAALGQQMYFWGRDVRHPDGNLLVAAGFSRRPSEGLTGTSCYRLTLPDGDLVELHGACVGRYRGSGGEEGFLYVRGRQRAFLYTGAEPPVPGRYPGAMLRFGTAGEMYRASCRFLDWWLAYEDWVAAVGGTGYRDDCFRAYRKLPASNPWLPPDRALAWLRAFRENPLRAGRARDWHREADGGPP